MRCEVFYIDTITCGMYYSLDVIPDVFFWLALAAWLLTFGGMARSIVAHLGTDA